MSKAVQIWIGIALGVIALLTALLGGMKYVVGEELEDAGLDSTSVSDMKRHVKRSDSLLTQLNNYRLYSICEDMGFEDGAGCDLLNRNMGLEPRTGARAAPEIPEVP